MNWIFGILFGLILVFGIMGAEYQNKIEKECEDKGGVLVQTYANDDVCVSKEYIIK